MVSCECFCCCMSLTYLNNSSSVHLFFSNLDNSVKLGGCNAEEPSKCVDEPELQCIIPHASHILTADYSILCVGVASTIATLSTAMFIFN